MRRVAIGLAFWFSLLSVVSAQTPLLTLGVGAPVVASGSGCTAATNFIARTSGLSGTENTAVTNLICGLVTDGIITGNLSGARGCGTVLDGFYVFAINTTTTANLNWCGTSYGLTTTATMTFTADRGYTGDGTAGHFDTNFNATMATSPNYVLNSGSLGSCQLNSRTTSSAMVSVGNANAGSFAYIEPLVTSTVSYELNGFTFPSVAASNAQGSFIVSRTSSSLVTLYKNGSSIGSSSSDNSVNGINNNIMIAALNNNGSVIDFSTDQLAYAFIGAGLSSTQANNIYSRLHTYLVAVGASAC